MPSTSIGTSDHVVVRVEEVVQVKDEQFDEDFLHRLISVTGRWAYGTVIVEMCVLTQE
jgi:hypothetical protein